MAGFVPGEDFSNRALDTYEPKTSPRGGDPDTGSLVESTLRCPRFTRRLRGLAVDLAFRIRRGSPTQEPRDLRGSGVYFPTERQAASRGSVQGPDPDAVDDPCRPRPSSSVPPSSPTAARRPPILSERPIVAAVRPAPASSRAEDPSSSSRIRYLPLRPRPFDPGSLTSKTLWKQASSTSAPASPERHSAAPCSTRAGRFLYSNCSCRAIRMRCAGAEPAIFLPAVRAVDHPLRGTAELALVTVEELGDAFGQRRSGSDADDEAPERTRSSTIDLVGLTTPAFVATCGHCGRDGTSPAIAALSTTRALTRARVAREPSFKTG